MERIVEQNLLYDFYGELLTAHQKEIYGEHILNDMTATEIAAEFGITLSRRLLKEDKEQMEEDIRQIESVCNQVLEDL